MAVPWDDVVAHGTTLPEVAESTSYGTTALKVANRLMGRLRTDSDGALALRCSAGDKVALVEGDDPAFFTTPHYDGHDYVLVDLDAVDRAELLELVTDAWHLVAPPAVRKRAAG
ncbi:MmcQ/YjbR family DNA-binding protein [Aeromicrobium stalagmiti]|uniref:MmcQ/YjbR family DNA-binding protein n=1 Tax=Aeromicrobium stalagmiti TaxID=2738988 RepID=UPI001C2BC287|nr:MmcQ/YjbR family DNA-binding protein [Aeromicrobium stalagmiti]